MRCVVLLLLSLALASPARAEDLARQLPVSEHGRLRVVLDRGDVWLMPHAGEFVRVVAEARGLGSRGMHFALREEAGQLLLEGRGAAWLGWLRGAPRVRVRLWVPRQLPVDVVTPGRIHTSDAGVEVAFPAR